MKLKLLSATILATISFNAMSSDGAYWRDSYGNIVRSGWSGECVQTISWTPADAIEECEGKTTDDKPTVTIVVVDSDGDGIVDETDKCAASPNDKPVDAEGCTIISVVMKNVNFETNSDQLTSSSNKSLDKAVESMKKYPELRIEIQAHSDSMGDSGYNQSLSDKRANSVRDYMIDQGIAADRMVAKGYGESQPVADNNTPDGRATNRRVELKIID